MRRFSRYLPTISLALALASPVVLAGCSARVGVYDQWHHDRHDWDDHEEIVFRGYLQENHRDYRPYKHLDRDDQKRYWDWRHDHPDRDKH